MENIDILKKTEIAEDIKEILKGLNHDKKYIPSRFFYDKKGIELFEKITRLPEYYLSRLEKSNLKNSAKLIVESFEHADIIELGSGDCSKILILLDAFSGEIIKNIRYIPVDISKEAIKKSATILSKKYKDLTIYGIQADFLKYPLPINSYKKKLICFFGSTLGNLYPEQAFAFLNEINTKMNTGDEFLLGLDMVKDISVLNRAYNDKKGITAAFNRNILNSINRNAGTLFKPELFEHLAFFNPAASRIEMHLKALEKMNVPGPFGEIPLKKGETIHTENSYKYTFGDIKAFSFHTGLKIKNIYSDQNKWFSLVHFKKT